MTYRFALGLAALAAAAVQASEPPPIADFVRHSTYSSARISPTGEYLALTVDRGGQDVLTVLRLSDLSVVKVNELPEEKSVAGVQWVSDDRLMFTATRKIGSFAAPASTGEWFAVNADGSQPRPVIFYGTRSAAELVNVLSGHAAGISGLKLAAVLPPALPGAGSGLPVQFVVSSTADHARVVEVADELMRRAMASGKFVYADNDLKYDMPQADLVIDKDKAALLGVSARVADHNCSLGPAKDRLEPVQAESSWQTACSRSFWVSRSASASSARSSTCWRMVSPFSNLSTTRGST